MLDGAGGSHHEFNLYEETSRNQGVRTIIYPVQDPARAKLLYSKLLGTEPYVDGPHYAGFRVGDQDIGLDPNGHKAGMTGPVGSWHVSDIEGSLRLLLDAGAQVQQPIKDVGGGKLMATARDLDGNIVGLIQSP